MSMAAGYDNGIFKVPSQANHSVILILFYIFGLCFRDERRAQPRKSKYKAGYKLHLISLTEAM